MNSPSHHIIGQRLSDLGNRLKSFFKKEEDTKPMKRDFTKEIEREFSARLTELGFQKKGLFNVKKVSPTVTWGIVCSIASFGFPDRGVIVQLQIENKEINELKHRMTGFISKRDYSFSYCLTLAKPDYEEWIFRRDEDNTAVMDDMISYIKTHGFPILEKITTIDGTIAFFGDNDHFLSTTALCYYLKGEKQKGIDLLSKKLDQFRNENKELQAKSLSEFLEKYKTL